jgi:hypothetical protein
MAIAFASGWLKLTVSLTPIEKSCQLMFRTLLVWLTSVVGPVWLIEPVPPVI